MNHDNILLQSEHLKLLEVVVEASRKLPSHAQHPFIVRKPLNGHYLVHKGLDSKVITYMGNVEALANEDLLRITKNDTRSASFDVTPLGYSYYEYIKKQQESPVAEVEQTILRYIVSDLFKENHRDAFEKWSEAQARLWESGVNRELTTIGHLCREALQEFSTSLIKKHLPNQQEYKDKSKTVRRIKAVIAYKKGAMGSSKTAFLDAILAYWGTVSDLVQKQEHDAQAEKEQLTWEDARMVVFHTILVMYEIDRAIKNA